MKGSDFAGVILILLSVYYFFSAYFGIIYVLIGFFQFLFNDPNLKVASDFLNLINIIAFVLGLIVLYIGNKSQKKEFKRMKNKNKKKR